MAPTARAADQDLEQGGELGIFRRLPLAAIVKNFEQPRTIGCQVLWCHSLIPPTTSTSNV